MSVVGDSRPNGGARKTITERWTLFLTILTAVSIAAAATYYASSKVLKGDKDPVYMCSYRVVVDSPAEGIHTTCVSIPCLNESAFAGDLDAQALASGEAELEIVSTLHGPALKISGRGKIAVNWVSNSSSREGGMGYYWNLTMLENVYEGGAQDRKAWISCDCENATIELYYSASYTWWPSPTFASGSRHEYEANSEPGDTGWRMVDCDVSGWIIN
ncbi:MAG: hypothetical protein JSV90_00055 [Methanobacteriota archaeon]|nr:MAG: hypothetical protein JSV90_00055 [Euryarchaeota archaeon]